MTDIVNLDEHRPHISGPVVCTRCRHKWVAVRPVGVDLLECSACGASLGASLDTMLHKPHIILGEGCCGQRDASGTCMAPACIFGEALKMAHEAAACIERLEAALRPLACTCTSKHPDGCSSGEVDCPFWNARVALAAF